MHLLRGNNTLLPPLAFLLVHIHTHKDTSASYDDYYYLSIYIPAYLTTTYQHHHYQLHHTVSTVVYSLRLCRYIIIIIIVVYLSFFLCDDYNSQCRGEETKITAVFSPSRIARPHNACEIVFRATHEQNTRRPLIGVFSFYYLSLTPSCRLNGWPITTVRYAQAVLIKIFTLPKALSSPPCRPLLTVIMFFIIHLVTITTTRPTGRIKERRKNMMCFSCLFVARRHHNGDLLLLLLYNPPLPPLAPYPLPIYLFLSLCQKAAPPQAIILHTMQLVPKQRHKNISRLGVYYGPRQLIALSSFGHYRFCLSDVTSHDVRRK